MAGGRIEPSLRYRIYAVPIVLSQIYFGRPYDYTGYPRVESAFVNSTLSIDELIARVWSVPDPKVGDLFFILADDKGTVDFTRLAFHFFGVKESSLYYMYFTILLVSCLLYVASYFADARRLALLLLLCLAFYATMPAFLAFPPGLNVLDVHAFGMLSIVAFLHILVAATDSHSTRPRQLLATLAQAFIMVFVYHSRASSITQAVGVVAGFPLILFFLHRRDRPPVESPRVLERVFGPQYVRRMVPAAIVLVAFSLLPVYQRLVYHPDYFGRRATLNHIVYHNLLIGLQWNSFLRDRYTLGSGDLGAAHAVDLYLETRTNKHPGRHGWAAENLNSITTQLPFDWVEYEEAARELYFTIWKEQPKQCLLTILYYHPIDVFDVFRLQMGYIPRANFDQQYAYNPFRPFQLLMLIAATVLCSIARRAIRPIDALIALVALGSSLLVPVLVYAGNFIVLAEAFVLAGLVAYAVLGVLLSRLIAHTFPRLRGASVLLTA